MERSSYNARGRGRNGGRNTYVGRGGYGDRDGYRNREDSYGGRDGNGGHNSYGGRGGNGGRGRNGNGDRGGFYQRSQSGGRGFPSQPQQQWLPHQPRPNPTSSIGSSNPNSFPQTQKQTQPDIGSLKISEQKTDTITPVRRPDNGGTLAVRTCNLRANHFPVTFNPRSVIMHYHVDVKANAPPMNNRPQKISKLDLSLIREKLFSDNSLPLQSSAYDGEKNIFSAVPLQEGTFSVDMSKGGDERNVSYSVTLALVNKLELRKLREYLSGSVLSIPRDILQGLDLVVKENPTKECVSLGKYFFPLNPPLKEKNLGHGIIAIGGFQQSLKPTSQGLALCVDYSVLSFRKKMDVLDFLFQHVRDFNLSEFGRFRGQVEQALIGLKVNVNHRKTKQKYTIEGLTSKITRHIKFPMSSADGQNPPEEVSLLSYFQEKHGVDIQHKDIPSLIFAGNKMNYVPMELCILVEGQRYPKENLDKNAANELKKMSVAPARERQGAIQAMVKSKEGPCGSGIIQNFGMSVNTSMTNVTGRVIQPPQVKLGNPNGEIISMKLEVEKCQWNLMGRSMVKGMPVECWGILDFTSRGPHYSRFKGKQFVERLIEKYRRFGIIMKEPDCHEESSMSSLGDYNSLCRLLENIDGKVQKRCRRRLQFLLCVMADKHQGYKCLKWIAETKVGIVTQCCLSSNVNEGKDQNLTNLALKINAKIGGSNVELINRLPHFEGEGHVMFIGADVNHPASRDTNSPSIAAVVGSVNWPAATRYAARVSAQGHRVEKIVNFGSICHELVSYYDRLNKVKPEKIVIFRDGVSESQFHMVLTEELQDLKSVFAESNYFPTITLIVAQKRHQTRFFPASAKDGISNGNVFPGTVVDTKVVHPFEFDFYLCSHYGSLGTSKPTHYHVLWDEHQFTSDDLQKLIYDLCFTFARCTKPVSLVPPVYYADLTAYRGRLYFEARDGMQSPAGSAASSSSHFTSASFSSTGSSLNGLGHYKLHADVENIMFFI